MIFVLKIPYVTETNKYILTYSNIFILHSVKHVAIADLYT